ncbi:tripartite tricarboxylate transporter TctB family protein [Pararhodobacter oceanensis]|uniref:tripartite tricarboxylate transporter TctB family protein n=1 Tax=Pararhodobacter oceanensis TaxID=2172121 RepID=UPI003A900FE1
MQKFDRNEVLAAIAMMAFGGIWLYIGLDYAWGNAVRIGAGVFPVALSLILIALCVLLIAKARSARPLVFSLHVRSLVLILGGILLWALSVDVIGFLPATAVLLAMCGLADPASTWRSIIGMTVFLCAFGYLVFIEALNVPMAIIGG